MKKQKPIKPSRKTWDINPVERVHSPSGYKRDSKLIKELNHIDWSKLNEDEMDEEDNDDNLNYKK